MMASVVANPTDTTGPLAGVLWTGRDEARALGLSEPLVSKARSDAGRGHPVWGTGRDEMTSFGQVYVRAPAVEVVAWWLAEVARPRRGRSLAAEKVARIRAVAAEHGITAPEPAPQEAS